MAKHMVKCKICEQTFDASAEPFIVEGRRYIHQHCYETREKSIQQKEKDYDDLVNYIHKLFKNDLFNRKVLLQIKQFRESNGFTYNGMKQALIWFYEIQKKPISESNGGIGIIPYIYDDAQKYYNKLNKAKNANTEQRIKEYNPIVKEIDIILPQPKKHLPKLFNLD